MARTALSVVAIFGTALVPVSAGMPASAQESEGFFIESLSGPNVIEFFLGDTYADHQGRKEHALSLGVSYRHEISPTVSIGGLAEYASDPFDAWVLGVPVVFELGRGWQLTTMPGAEIEDGEEEFLFRTGIGYEIEMEGGYSVKPEVNADVVDGDVSWVFGASLGFRF